MNAIFSMCIIWCFQNNNKKKKLSLLLQNKWLCYCNNLGTIQSVMEGEGMEKSLSFKSAHEKLWNLLILRKLINQFSIEWRHWNAVFTLEKIFWYNLDQLISKNLINFRFLNLSEVFLPDFCNSLSHRKSHVLIFSAHQIQ